MTQNSNPFELDDDILAEYDFSHLQGVRGKHAEAMRQGYSVTVHHQDGTSTTQYIQPNHSMSDAPNLNDDQINGDQVMGDKITGDKVIGDKVAGNKVTNNLQGANIGNLVNEAKDNAQVTASQFTQTSNVNTAELLSLIAQLRQTAIQFPPEVQEDVTIDIDDIEAEIKKPEKQRNLARLKKRLIALAMIGSAIAAPIASVTDFVNTAIDLGNKLGIELQLPAGH